MKDLKEMTVEELIEGSKSQYKIASEAENQARRWESAAIQKFLTEHNLKKVVLHKERNIKGKLCVGYDTHRGYLVQFYPLKKNGEVSSRVSLDSTVWCACYGLKKNFENLLSEYEPCEDTIKEENDI